MRPDDSQIDFAERFDNWVRWCRSGSGQPCGHAYSLEGLYTGPQGKGHPYGWGDWASAVISRYQYREPVIVPDAHQVNTAYWQLPDRPRKVIKLIWFTSLAARTKARKLNIHYLQLADTGRQAQQQLQDQLHRIEYGRPINYRKYAQTRPTARNMEQSSAGATG